MTFYSLIQAESIGPCPNTQLYLCKLCARFPNTHIISIEQCIHSKPTSKVPTLTVQRLGSFLSLCLYSFLYSPYIHIIMCVRAQKEPFCTIMCVYVFLSIWWPYQNSNMVSTYVIMSFCAPTFLPTTMYGLKHKTYREGVSITRSLVNHVIRK